MASYLSMKSVTIVGNISVIKQAMGVMQHHDAITGTSKQFVIDDHIRFLHRGFEECFKIRNSFYQYSINYQNVNWMSNTINFYSRNNCPSLTRHQRLSSKFLIVI